ncbi:MAG: hypothetical protein ACJ8FY_23740 [Gemmataceae bacterium]
MRKIAWNAVTPPTPCTRCRATGCQWDRIAGKAMCPDCQEDLALGRGEPFIERTEKHRCTVCSHLGTVRYITFPLVPTDPVEMDLCADHFRGLISRRLLPHSFLKLRRLLNTLELRTEQLFLLHEAFYDERGQALQPALEVE